MRRVWYRILCRRWTRVLIMRTNGMAAGMWRVDHYHMKAKEYRNEYFKNFETDEPVEQYDDRNRLYCVKEKIMYSAHVPGSKARAQALEDLEFLIQKYASDEGAVKGD